MSDASERRAETRFITTLPLVVLDADGATLDATATAHDLTTEGFKGELVHELKSGETFAFTLGLADGRPPARGAAEVMWVKKTDYACWIGARITRMAWSDKRRLKAALAPPSVDWEGVGGHFFNAVFWLVVVFALQRLLFGRTMWRGVLLELVPSLAALAVMGWALLGFLRRR